MAQTPAPMIAEACTSRMAPLTTFTTDTTSKEHTTTASSASVLRALLPTLHIIQTPRCVIGAAARAVSLVLTVQS